MRKLLIISASMLLLASCGGQNAREIIGLGKRAPDEFRVVSRPPLSVPPDFTLRPPQNGESSTFQYSAEADVQARNVITGESSGSTYPFGGSNTAIGSVNSQPLGSATMADQTFLSNAGANNANPAIRQQLYQDVTSANETEKESDYLFDWLGSNEAEGEVIVDAQAEKKRLEENVEANRPVTVGETPMIDPGNKAPLEQLFD